MMATCTIHVTGGRCRLAAAEPVTSGSQNSFSAEFSFDSQWAGLNKVATFTAGDTSRSVVLEDSGVAVIPWECLRTCNETLFVGVTGMNAEGAVVLNSTVVPVGVVARGNDAEADAGAVPTAALLSQVLAASDVAAGAAQSASAAAAGAGEAAVRARDGAEQAAASASQARTAADAADVAASAAQTVAAAASKTAEEAATTAVAAKELSEQAEMLYQPKGPYLTAHQSLAAYRTAAEQTQIDAAQDQSIAGKLDGYLETVEGYPLTSKIVPGGQAYELTVHGALGMAGVPSLQEPATLRPLLQGTELYRSRKNLVPVKDAEWLNGDVVVTVHKTGVVVVKGTLSEDNEEGGIAFSRFKLLKRALEAGQHYTFSSTATAVPASMRLCLVTTKAEILAEIPTTGSASFVSQSAQEVYLGIGIYQAGDYDLTFSAQLELGDTATPFEPAGDPVLLGTVPCDLWGLQNRWDAWDVGSGTVTRRCRMKELDGTEIEESSAVNEHGQVCGYYALRDAVGSVLACSSLPVVDAIDPATTARDEIAIDETGTLTVSLGQSAFPEGCEFYSEASRIIAFQTLFQSLAGAGKPVTIVYQAEPVTERYAGNKLDLPEGICTVSCSRAPSNLVLRTVDGNGRKKFTQLVDLSPYRNCADQDIRDAQALTAESVEQPFVASAVVCEYAAVRQLGNMIHLSAQIKPVGSTTGELAVAVLARPQADTGRVFLSCLGVESRTSYLAYVADGTLYVWGTITPVESLAVWGQYAAANG